MEDEKRNEELVNDITALLERRKIGFFKLDPAAQIPKKGTPNSVGWDLYSLENVNLSTPLQTIIIRTGVGVKIPTGCYARIAPRSGMSIKGLVINAGVIDRDYQAEIKLIVYCINNSIEIKKGDRIAQLILEKVDYSDMPEIEPPAEQNTHVGFGSTGN